MRRLWLLRHAKSSWDDPSLDDHERPLAPRGERDAAAMAAYLRRAEVRPDLVLCSSAVRARDTLTGVLPGLGPDLRIVVERSLYTFEHRRLADALAAATDRADAILLVGHNPAIQGLAERLSREGTSSTGSARSTRPAPSPRSTSTSRRGPTWRPVRVSSWTSSRRADLART